MRRAPIWAIKGWPPGKTFDQVLTLDTAAGHIVFTPFTRSDQQMVFDAATDRVTMQTLGGEPVQTLAQPRAAFKGMLRDSDWDRRIADVGRELDTLLAGLITLLGGDPPVQLQPANPR